LGLVGGGGVEVERGCLGIGRGCVVNRMHFFFPICVHRLECCAVVLLLFFTFFFFNKWACYIAASRMITGEPVISAGYLSSVRQFTSKRMEKQYVLHSLISGPPLLSSSEPIHPSRYHRAPLFLWLGVRSRASRLARERRSAATV
jgi:hypothetical protein